MSTEQTNNGTVGGSSSGTMDTAMEKLLQRGFSELERADGSRKDDKEDTSRLFGVIELPTTFVTVFNGIWNEAAHGITEWLGPRTFGLSKDLLGKVGVHGQTQTRTAAAASLLIGTGIKSAAFIDPIVQSYKQYHQERAKLLHELAPVLDEIKGGHSMGKLMSVRADENEVIYAHRRRMALKAHTQNANQFINLGVNVAPSVLMDLPDAQTRWNHDGISELSQKQPGTVQTWIERIVRMGSSPIAQLLSHKNERALKQKVPQPYSALDMIIKLEEQVREDPNASSFALPEGGGRDLPLEDYLSEILVEHQKDMAAINPDYSVIRKALREELPTVVKPLAEAIRKGDLSAMSLIRLVGEGKIVLKKGRALADSDAIQSLVGKIEKKVQPQAPVDSKEYYAEATFTKDDLKAALKAMDGQEKTVFAAMFPDSILQEAGMSEDEVKAVREGTLKNYAHHLSGAIAALASKSDEELKKDGLAQDEIKKIHEAFEAIGEKGEEEGIKPYKTGPANAHGIEQTLANLAVTQVKGDKGYFGKLLSHGNQQLSSMPPKEEPTAPTKDNEQDETGHFAKREQRTMGGEAAEAAR